MGQTESEPSSKDPNIEIAIELSQNVYNTGEIVKGSVYLEVKQDSEYSELKMDFYGKESVQVVEYYNRQAVPYFDLRQNYLYSCQLQDFNGLLVKGQYSFPFQLNLPENMSGSYFYDFNNYIRYKLRTVLVHKTETEKNQTGTSIVNLLEIPRIQKGQCQHQVQQKVKPFGFQIFGNSGDILISLKCNKSYAYNGEEIQVVVNIQNNSTVNINSFQARLKQVVVLVAADHDSKTSDKTWKIHEFDVSIPPGSKQDFGFIAKIPEEIQYPTAIGSIIANYYIISVKAITSMFSGDSRGQVHIVVLTNKPKLQENPKIEIPQNWNPKVFDTYKITEMPAFHHKPSQKILYLNLSPEEELQVKEELQEAKEELEAKEQQQSKEEQESKEDNTAAKNIQEDEAKLLKKQE